MSGVGPDAWPVHVWTPGTAAALAAYSARRAARARTVAMRARTRNGTPRTRWLDILPPRDSDGRHTGQGARLRAADYAKTSSSTVESGFPHPGGSKRHGFRADAGSPAAKAYRCRAIIPS